MESSCLQHREPNLNEMQMSTMPSVYDDEIDRVLLRLGTAVGAAWSTR